MESFFEDLDTRDNLIDLLSDPPSEETLTDSLT